MSKNLSIVNRAIEHHLRHHASVAEKIFEFKRHLPFSSEIMEKISEISRTHQEMKKLGPFKHFIENENSLAAELFGGFESRFRLPMPNELSHFSELLNNSWSPIAQHLESFNLLQREMKAIRTPWIDIENIGRSISGAAELQAIGQALKSMEPFSPKLTTDLRMDLGDWRSVKTFPEIIFDDPVARTDFYENLGFNQALTAFPQESFHDLLDLTGLRLPKRYISNRPKAREHDDCGFKRNNNAYAVLLNFEIKIRHFIVSKMTQAVGNNWIKHRVPGDMLFQWKEKREKAREQGEKLDHLIAYADFGDYAKIIIRKDNWRDVFQPVFHNKESVQESFRRLHPIRGSTMHSRFITPDDQLYLFTETRRLMKAIGEGS